MSPPRKLRHGEAKQGEQLFFFAADNLETSFRSRPRAVSPRLDTTRHGKGSLGSPWGSRAHSLRGGESGWPGRGRSAPGGPTSAPEAGPRSPAFPPGLREGSPSAGESAAAPPSQPAVIYLFSNQGGRPTPFHCKLETAQEGAPSPSRVTPRGEPPWEITKGQPLRARDRTPAGRRGASPSRLDVPLVPAEPSPARGGCCRAPRGAQLVGTGRRVQARGSGRAGGSPRRSQRCSLPSAKKKSKWLLARKAWRLP